MERISAIAGTGLAASTGTLLVQQEKRVALLDLDVFMGCLSIDVPLGNLVVLLGFCFSAYAFWRARQHAKEQKRRTSDSFPESVVRNPDE